LSTDSLIQMDSNLVRDKNIIFSDMDGETVMMSIERGEYYGINPIGSRIWGLLQTPKRVTELCGLLLPDFDVAPEQCASDVLQFLNQMAEKGIITIITE
jgi:hypothetical protein